MDTILFNKDGFCFRRLRTNSYSISFNVENKHIHLPNILDFSLIKLIYDLNPDVYEKADIVISDTSPEATVTLLMKHFFEDLGLPQRYSFVHMTKTIDEECNLITFSSQSIRTHRPDNVPEEAELMALSSMNCLCNTLNPHNIQFSVFIKFDDTMQDGIPPFAEKMVGMISHKIFKRVKQFIENVRI